MDLDRLTPVEQVQKRQRCIRYLIVAALLALLVYCLVFRSTYVIAYENPVEHFAHGSIGSEAANGLPYWVFKSLPELYKAELGPGGYQRFGFLYANPGDDLPIGFSRRVVQGIERVWLNCSVCHVGTYREAAGGERKLLYGAPANNLRLYEFIQFLRSVAVDSRFSGENVVAAIERVGGDLSLAERVLYRYLIVDRVRSALMRIRDQLAFMDRQQDWGPGRVDTFNPYKSIQFNFPMTAATTPVAVLDGSSDYPSIWMQRPRHGMQLHWDGNNTSVDERNLSAALGAGVTPVSVDIRSIRQVRDWIWDLPAPKYPRSDLDPQAVARGRSLFGQHCADCHGGGGARGYDYDTSTHTRLGRVEPLSRIRTDRGRWDSYTEPFAGAQNLLYAGYPWRFTHFRKTDGYSNQPLDGIWARSPYLHNGSVPTLRDLLDPAPQRPQRWSRGGDVFDFKKVGYRYDGTDAPTDGLFAYDTGVPGNANTGHDGAEYGTTLPEADKEALVEYMKTL